MNTAEFLDDLEARCRATKGAKVACTPLERERLYVHSAPYLAVNDKLNEFDKKAMFDHVHSARRNIVNAIAAKLTNGQQPF